MITPLKNRVILKQIKSDPSKGGILLPESAKPKKYAVASVPAGCLDFKPGDEVIFPEGAGNRVTHNGEALIFIHQYDIMAVILP